MDSAAIVALVFAAGGVAFLYRVPAIVWGWVVRFSTVSVTVRDRQLVGWVSEWLGEQDYGNVCRLLSATLSNTVINDDGRRAVRRIVLAPGLGMHFFRWNGRLFWLDRNIEKEGDEFFPVETITLRALGRDRGVIEQLSKEVYQHVRDIRAGRSETFVATDFGEWVKVAESVPRPLESVILVGDTVERIESDVRSFLDSEDWYRSRGVPYRRGYLLHGPPGNGKSSIAQAVAGHFGMPLYVLTIQGPEGDSKLNRIVAQIPRHAAVLIEDIDCVMPSRNGNNEGVTMAGLLNVIDGPTATEGRLLFMTTNDVGAVDAALKRPGRADVQLEIGLPTKEQARRLYQRFNPGDVAGCEAFVKKSGGQSMAQLQERLLNRFRGV